ncbi:transmembrane protein, putative [Medicago truncatula]|uniref:Transmembrane protein, putative n=1 Tax=Medicago truncatula TaxID=3880 RepID=G7KMV1_MEDTR|nr:transmembrane protein, putative [Medicago truncatula]
MQIVNGHLTFKNMVLVISLYFVLMDLLVFVQILDGEVGGRLILTDQQISAFVFSETVNSYEDGIIKSVA